LEPKTATFPLHIVWDRRMFFFCYNEYF
jgi:hypothetical protein